MAQVVEKALTPSKPSNAKKKKKKKKDGRK
jgi:hypothetical protein